MTFRTVARPETSSDLIRVLGIGADPVMTLPMRSVLTHSHGNGHAMPETVSGITEAA